MYYIFKINHVDPVAILELGLH